MHLVFEYTPELFPNGALVGKYFAELLGELGYHVTVRSISGDQLFDENHELQAMTLGGWFADYPAASNFFSGILTCDAAYPFFTFCDHDIDAMIDRASRLQTEDPAAAGALWVRIDRAVVDRSPFWWLITPLTVEFVSERVGNYQWNFQWGTLLNQLWVN
jgi:peptide/nickel transport system substrate-binding protein